MKLNELLNAINLGNLSILLFLVLSLVEISPIKINPWSMLIRWFARLLGISDLKTEIVQVRDRMDELEKKIDNMKISNDEKNQLKEALAARHLTRLSPASCISSDSMSGDRPMLRRWRSLE